jgi:tripartite-type tricarboxylate transporter receptor subunit TctC
MAYWLPAAGSVRGRFSEEEPMKIIFRIVSIVVAVGLGGIAPAHAQYPTHSIRFIVPFAAGSGNDTVARFIQPQLAAALGQQIVVDNRAGAAGNLGAAVAAEAAPDGYTMMMANIAHSISVTLYRRLSYKFVKDFAPVTQLASGSFTLAVHPSLPARSVKQLIALAQKRPGEINIATAGAAIQLSAKLLESMAGIKMTEVSYKSTPQAITALIGGEASVGFPATSSVLPHVRAGRLRALAVTSAQRSSMAPNVPTLAESGVAGFDVSPWYGVVVPAATPKEIVARLHDTTVTALRNPEVKKRFAGTDLETVGSTPEQFGAHIRSEVAKWAKVIKDSGMQIE